MPFGLLMHPFIGIRALPILFAIARIEEHLGHNQRVCHGEIRGKKPGLRALKFNAEPVETAGAHLAVIEVFNVIGTAGDVQRFIGVGGSHHDGLGLGDGVIWFGFDDHAATRSTEIDGLDTGAQRDVETCGPGSDFGEAFHLFDAAGFAPAGQVEDRFFVRYGGDLQLHPPGNGRPVHHVEIRIERVQNLAIACPFHGNTTVGREFGRRGQTYGYFDGFPGLQRE